MADRTARHNSVLLALGVALGFSGAACGRADAPQTTTEAAGTLPADRRLSGRVTVDGSSTVLPASRAMAAAFQTLNPGVRVSMEASGTGAGLQKLCTGQIDIAAASRPINAAESHQCQNNRVEFIELPFAFDSLSVVVSAGNAFVQCLTVGELKKLWEPSAERRVTRWNQVRSTFPSQRIALFGPGTNSGTFDYFTLAIVGAERSSRSDFTKSEDDTVLVNGVAADPDAIGYFGYAYYLANKDKVKLVAVDNGHGCVLPSRQTVADGSYQPLSRPMFVYVNKSSASRAEARALAAFFVAPENARYVREVGYVPLPPVTLLADERRLDKMVTGSVFRGRGSVLGVTAETFENEDGIKSALVQ